MGKQAVLRLHLVPSPLPPTTGQSSFCPRRSDRAPAAVPAATSARPASARPLRGSAPRWRPPPGFTAGRRKVTGRRSCRGTFKPRRSASRSSPVSPGWGGRETDSPDSLPKPRRGDDGGASAPRRHGGPAPSPPPPWHLRAGLALAPRSPAASRAPPSSPRPTAGEGEPGKGQTTPPGRRRLGRPEAAGHGRAGGEGTPGPACRPPGGRGHARQRRARQPATTPDPRSPHQMCGEEHQLRKPS
ncbi:uncharacterized protein [Ciconia boyciana]|uniref:uncharacterized protein n=1 Tax=Ciconia boyciana TaxID=52775 RepID=UPI003BA04EFD